MEHVKDSTSLDEGQPPSSPFSGRTTSSAYGASQQFPGIATPDVHAACLEMPVAPQSPFVTACHHSFISSPIGYSSSTAFKDQDQVSHRPAVALLQEPKLQRQSLGSWGSCTTAERDSAFERLWEGSGGLKSEYKQCFPL